MADEKKNNDEARRISRQARDEIELRQLAILVSVYFKELIREGVPMEAAIPLSLNYQYWLLSHNDCGCDGIEEVEI
jgi:hypothetical protein